MEAQYPGGAPVVQPASSLDNLRGTKGWMKFIGIISIIGGALGGLLSLIGIGGAGRLGSGLVLINIISLALSGLGIWVGSVLFQAGSRVDLYLLQPGEPTLAEFTAKLKLYFVLVGVNLIIGLVMVLITVISVWSIIGQIGSLGSF
ncbi:MAG: DUF5362 family protein [candidate division WOR-3 bacterium]